MNDTAPLETLPTLTDIEAAAQRIQAHAVRTPLLEFPTLNEGIGGRVFIKPENLQRTGSFKFRGAFNTLQTLKKDQLTNGVIASSSGNHAQGIAEAARLFGCPAAIVMPANAPTVKRDRVLASGAEVVPYDRETEDRIAIALDLCAQRQATFVHPFDHFDVICGQGTVGLEIAEDLKALDLTPDTYLCCCGGGGLLNGSATALRAHYPDLSIIGVEPDGFDDWQRSLEAGHQVSNDKKAGSICDAIITERPGDLPWKIAQSVGLSIKTVSDHQALHAVGYAYDQMRLLVEPGGAVALAAALNLERQPADAVTVLVLSGGNIDPAMLSQAQERYELD